MKKEKCYNCDKFGHYARDCSKPKNVQKANVARVYEDEDDEGCSKSSDE